jgi:hypothetical protein
LIPSVGALSDESPDVPPPRKGRLYATYSLMFSGRVRIYASDEAESDPKNGASTGINTGLVCPPYPHRSKMTYACPTWESAADTHLLKLQRLQNKVLRIIGGLPRLTPIRYMHAEFQIPYVYVFITKVCRKQAEVIQNHDNENVR